MDDVAIIGMACRFPKAHSPAEFWENLIRGRECLTEHSEADLLAAGVAAEEFSHPQYVRTTASLEGIENFDAGFFDYSPREASLIDPQHRLFLQEAWKALEDANCPPEAFRGRIGVYAGTGMNTYLFENIQTHADLIAASGGYPVMVASDKDFLATRVSYKLNLKGPSLTIQTACSSSLVAIHTACQSLRAGECDLALAGGVSLRVPQNAGYLYQEGLILSPDGHCRAFDEGAQGTVIGNGVGVIVLKMLEDALHDGDEIYAVIKGSALNNDGSQKVGYTAPGLDSQAAVIYEALSISDVEASSISYVEAHGTGTPLGDPIEIAALTKAFAAASVPRQSCALGSVKTNIGHLDAAAGVAGIIKTALALHHQCLPASLNFEQPNPKIDFAASPFFVNTSLRPWPRGETPRRAGVSSFGIGGTNAHAILEEAPPRQPKPPTPSEDSLQVIGLSARSQTALDHQLADLAAWMEANPQVPLADMARTLATGRTALPRRWATACRDRKELLSALRSPQATGAFRAHAETKSGRLAFVFPGQGAQTPGMAADLYANEPVFRQAMDRGFALAAQHGLRDLPQALYPSDSAPGASERLDRTEYSQLGLFLVEYSLGRLWQSRGVRPAWMLGHSVGEYAAACLAGVFSFEDAVDLLVERGRLIAALPEGRMLAVALSEAQLKLELEAVPELGLSLAAVNGPRACVVAGSTGGIQALAQKLSAGKIAAVALKTSHAFHSSALDPMLPAFRSKVQSLRLSPPTVPLVSSCTGTWLRDSEAIDPEYWVRHLRQTVRFQDAAQVLLALPDLAALEVGPGNTLTSLLTQLAQPEAKPSVVSSLPSPERALAALWTWGEAAGWNLPPDSAAGPRVRMPTYRFDQQRCWIDRSTTLPRTAATGTPEFRIHPAPLAGPPASPAGSCLVFAVDAPWCHELLTRWKQHFDHVELLMPDQDSSPAALLGRISALPSSLRTVVYLWALDDAPTDAASHRRRLSQLTGVMATPRPLRLSVWLRNLVDISGAEEIDPEWEPLVESLGPLRETRAHLEFQLVDVGAGPALPEPSDLVRTVVLPWEAETEPLVAFRGKRRWVQSRPRPQGGVDAPPAGGLSTGGRPEMATPYRAPEGDTETAVVRIWESTLGVSPIGTADNFFELGGNSLMLAQIVALVREEFHSDAPLLDVLYENPTPGHLAAFFDAVASPVFAAVGHDSDATFETGEL